MIADVAVRPPFCVVAVMVAVPAETPGTSPVLLTVATAVLLDVQLTFWLVAFAGVIVAESWPVKAHFLQMFY